MRSDDDDAVQTTIRKSLAEERQKDGEREREIWKKGAREKEREAGTE